MTNSRAARLLTLVACAATLACGRNDDATDERSARPGDRPAETAALVSLTGCVAAAPGTASYVLRNVRFEPRTSGDPHAATTTAGGHGITEGAWVRLEAEARDLKEFLGQRVVVNGAISDDGRNTIGTAGTPGVQTPTGDRSQAASQEHHSDKQKKEMGRIGRESMADGTAAAVRVKDIKSTGERCLTR